MNKADFCEAFCERIGLHKVPIGFVLKTPFRRADSDAIALYLRQDKADSKRYRVEDDGETIPFLEALGVDFDNERRFEALSDLLRESEAFWDEADNVIHTEYVDETRVPAMAVRFSGLMLRVLDLHLLSVTRVRSTFREDLLKMVEAQFGSDAQIDVNAPLQPSMKDYEVDIIVRAKDGRALAIFAGTSELKALEALLFSKEQREQGVTNVRPMLVLETAKPQEIKARTLSRVMNSNILLASMDGEEIAIKQKMAESLMHR